MTTTPKPARPDGECVNCGERRLLDPATRLCVSCLEFDVDFNPADQGEAQVDDAIALLEQDPAGIVSWPFHAVDVVAGPMAPGNVWYVAAFSGGGKTTFLTSCIRRWLDAGVRVAVLPLELRPSEWRVGFACQRLGIPPGDALSGRLRQQEAAGNPDAKRAREQIADEVRLWHIEDRSSALYLAPFQTLALDRFYQCALLARRYGYRVVVIDHVDHVDDGSEDGGNRNAVAVSQAVNRALPQIAQRLGLIIVATSQLNLSATAGHRLAKYEAPQVQHLWYPGVKIQSATGILGLYRPLDPAADLGDVKAARAGDIEPHKVLKPNAMGVVAMKLRNLGAHEGKRVELTVARGAVEDQLPQDAHRIETGGASVRGRGWS